MSNPAPETFFGKADWPGTVLIGALIACFVVQVFVAPFGPGWWGTSAEALKIGRWDTLFTHMFVHANAIHLAFNLSGMAAFAYPVAKVFPKSPPGRLLFFALYLISGLAGGLTFVAINPDGSAPVVGASGAICGLWGAATALYTRGALPGALLKPPARRQVIAFIAMNLILVGLVFVATGLAGGPIGGVAWEAHLGGFIVGLILARPFAGSAYRLTSRPTESGPEDRSSGP